MEVNEAGGSILTVGRALKAISNVEAESTISPGQCESRI